MPDLFQAEIAKDEARLKSALVVFQRLGYAKLLVTAALLICLLFTFQKGEVVLPLLALDITLLALAAPLYIRHAHNHAQVDFYKGLLSIHRRNTARKSRDFSDVKDDGADFLVPDHPYAKDLDIVGNHSLYRLLNRAHTHFGRSAFASALLSADYNREEIIKRQEAVEELSQFYSFTCALECHSELVGNDTSIPKRIRDFEGSPVFIKSKMLQTILIYAPAVTFLFLCIVFTFQWTRLYPSAFFFLGAQLLIWLLLLPRTSACLRSLYKLPFKLSAYREMFRLVEKEKFSAPLLIEMQAQCKGEAAECFRALDRLTSKASVRGNILVSFLMNVLFLYDIECAIQFSNWTRSYGPKVEGFLRTLGEFESLMSLALLPLVSERTSLPSLHAEKSLAAELLGHPLLKNEECVFNPVRIAGELLVVSGSNMSGKTTYMRAVGVNLVLLRSGGYVAAENMHAFPFRVMTSMRLTDDLSAGVSTFYAELTRIKAILDRAAREDDLLFLIDEIFRGTNSVDRLMGAKSVLRRLHENGTAGIVTTHDLELCTLTEEYTRIRNVSFHERLQEGKLLFDYRLRDGVSSTTNGQFLMKLLGIL